MVMEQKQNENKETIDRLSGIVEKLLHKLSTVNQFIPFIQQQYCMTHNVKNTNVNNNQSVSNNIQDNNNIANINNNFLDTTMCENYDLGTVNGSIIDLNMSEINNSFGEQNQNYLEGNKEEDNEDEVVNENIDKPKMNKKEKEKQQCR